MNLKFNLFLWIAYISFGACEKVLVVSTIPTADNCMKVGGYQIILQSIANKVEYCRRHDYYLKIFHYNPDPELDDHWNKVGVLRYVLSKSIKYSQYDWIVWADYDLLFMRLNDPITFSKYENYDIVVGGLEKLLNETPIDCYQVLNTGVIYFRSSQETLNFVNEWRNFGLLMKVVQYWRCFGVLKNFEYLQDQRAFIWLIAKNQELQKKIFFEEYDQINGFWKAYLVVKNNSKLFIDGDPFIKHWSGCKICTKVDDENFAQCFDDFSQTVDLLREKFEQH